MTNYDRIKSMSLEEMVRFFEAIANCDRCSCNDCVCYDIKNSNCPLSYTKEWLLQEVARMTDNEIIQEATETVEKNLNAGCYVGDLLRIVKEQQAEKERLEYVLMAAMHSVDKWLEGGELNQDEANRACTMREKTLKIIERLHKKIDGLKKANQESWVAIEKKKAEIERLSVKEKTLKAIINHYERQLKSAKSEAYEEFAERLKAQDGYDNHIFDDCASLLVPEEYRKGRDEKIKEIWGTIDNLVKELTESNE